MIEQIMDVLTSPTAEEIVDAMQNMSHECINERVVEQMVLLPVSQVVGEGVEMVQITSQERLDVDDQIVEVTMSQSCDTSFTVDADSGFGGEKKTRGLLSRHVDSVCFDERTIKLFQSVLLCSHRRVNTDLNHVVRVSNHMQSKTRNVEHVCSSMRHRRRRDRVTRELLVGRCDSFLSRSMKFDFVVRSIVSIRLQYNADARPKSVSQNMLGYISRHQLCVRIRWPTAHRPNVSNHESQPAWRWETSSWILCLGDCWRQPHPLLATLMVGQLQEPTCSDVVESRRRYVSDSLCCVCVAPFTERIPVICACLLLWTVCLHEEVLVQCCPMTVSYPDLHRAPMSRPGLMLLSNPSKSELRTGQIREPAWGREISRT